MLKVLLFTLSVLASSSSFAAKECQRDLQVVRIISIMEDNNLRLPYKSYRLEETADTIESGRSLCDGVFSIIEAAQLCKAFDYNDWDSITKKVPHVREELYDALEIYANQFPGSGEGSARLSCDLKFSFDS